jgi:two-component system, LytTR family, response regulator
MIDSIIIDDEHHNVGILQTLLAEFCPDVRITGIANNSQEGLKLITEQNPALVFLDIEMPFGNAFDLLGKLLPVTFEVIFVTAFDQYAIRAFEYVALDYLLKPISIEKLKAAVNKARQRIQEKNVNMRIDSLISNFRNNSPDLKKIGLQVADGVVFEEINHLVHLEAEGSYTFVYTNDKKKRIVSKSLKEFEDILPEAIFYRLHHSHIVNLNYIKKYYKGRGGYVELEDGTIVEVSARKRDEFLKKFNV